MWCVPEAIAALTGWSREKVWLDVLAQRYERGRRLTNIPGRIDEPHGGLHAAEALRSLDRAGYDAIDAWPSGTRRWTREQFEWFAYTETFPNPHVGRVRSQWLVMQQMHLAFYDTGYRIAEERGTLIDTPIAKAWRIVKRVGGEGGQEPLTGLYTVTLENGQRPGESRVPTEPLYDAAWWSGEWHRDEGWPEDASNGERDVPEPDELQEAAEHFRSDN